MKLAIAIAVVVTLAACWTEPRAPRAGSAVAGTIWSTPSQLWRTSIAAYAMAVDGDTILLGGASGWIGRFDLITGRMVHEREYGKLFVSGLVKLRDGRWLVVGNEDQIAVAFVVDLKTHATSRVVLGAVKGDYATPGAVMLDDGGVVITGAGLPLAVYDPQTWSIREVLSSELTWSLPVVSGTSVVAMRKAHAYRFEIGSTTTKDLGLGAGAAVHGEHVALRSYHQGTWFAQLANQTTGKSQRLEEAHDFKFDAEGKRFALLSKGVVIVRALPDARVIARFDLGDAARDTGSLAFDRERIIVRSSSVIRVIDLATSSVTPAGEPPIGVVEQLSVDDQGAILAIGRGLAWRFADGMLTSSSSYGADVPLLHPRGELRRYASTKSQGDTAKVTLHAVSSHRARRTWESPQDAIAGWLGRNGTVVLDAFMTSSHPSRVLRSQGDEMVEVIAHNSDATVTSVDVDRGIAMLDWKGTVHLVSLKDGKRSPHTLRVPRCQDYAIATAQTDGRRVAVFDTNDVIIWNSATGEVVTSGHFPGYVSQVDFLPGGTEVLVGVERELMLWNLATQQVQAIEVPNWQLVALSPDARRLALALGDGRIALVDVETMRAAMRTIEVPATKIPETCPDPDPFEVPADERGESDSEFDDEDPNDYDEDSGP